MLTHIDTNSNKAAEGSDLVPHHAAVLNHTFLLLIHKLKTVLSAADTKS